MHHIFERISKLTHSISSQSDKNCSNGHLLVNLTGGLGNQLFQFANGVSVALETNSEIAFNYMKGSRRYNLSFLGIKTKEFYSVSIIRGELTINPSTKCHHDSSVVYAEPYFESSFTHQPIKLAKVNNELNGYFQSHKYFAPHKRAVFHYLRKKLSSFGENFAHELIIHIRLGDLVANPVAREFHGILTEEYYLTAIGEYFLDKEIVIVAEDINQASIHFPNVVRLAKKCISSNPVSDLATMSRAKQLITANSTLSLWAGYISDSRTVVPSSWFTPKVLKENAIDDLFFEDWIKI
jgi:hypothetical protein